MVFQGQQLETKKGTLVNGEEVVNGAKIIAVIFSAQWCPPCRGFTPRVKEFYESDAVKDSGLVIIFVSSDRSEEAMKTYFTEHHGDYYAVPFSNIELMTSLKENCEVKGIPVLAVIDKNGKCLHREGRDDVTTGPPSKVVEKWSAIASK